MPEQDIEKKDENIEKAAEKETFSLKEWAEKHPKAVFAIRFFFWTLFAAILPFTFIAWRYGIFSNKSYIRLTGWGLIGIVIIIVFVITLVRYIYKGLRHGMLRQCIGGFVGIVLPLTAFYLLICGISDDVNMFKQALGCVIICETVAIPFNPFPDWLYKRAIAEGKERADTLSDIVWEKFFDKAEKRDKNKGKGE